MFPSINETFHVCSHLLTKISYIAIPNFSGVENVILPYAYDWKEGRNNWEAPKMLSALTKCYENALFQSRLIGPIILLVWHKLRLKLNKF